MGSFLLSVFFFPFLPFSIPCVFTVLFPYTSGIFLYMCDYWSCSIGWVCLTMARVLCLPSDLYMPVYIPCATITVLLLMCLLLCDCHWGWLCANPGPFCKSTSCDNIKNVVTFSQNVKNQWVKVAKGTTIWKVFRNMPQSFGKASLWTLSFVYQTRCSRSQYVLRFQNFKSNYYLTEPTVRSPFQTCNHSIFIATLVFNQWSHNFT